MHFESRNAFLKCLKLYLFPELKNNLQKICVPTLPKISRSVTQNTLDFLFGLTPL